MKKELIHKPEIKLIGLTARTNNKNEMNPKTAKIGEASGRFWSQNIASRIPNRQNPHVTLCAYTEFESDKHGDYTYFIGEEVSSFDQIPDELHQLTIPASKYQKFTTPTGKCPEVVINAWQQIWKMSSDDFGGKRTYVADFEVYDQRAIDPNNMSLDKISTLELVMNKYLGECYCGAIKFYCDGDPFFTQYCHCNKCREVASHSKREVDKLGYAWTAGYLRSSLHITSNVENLEGIIRNNAKLLICKFCQSLIYGISLDPNKQSGIGVNVTNFQFNDSLPASFNAIRHIWYINRVVNINDDLPKFKDAPIEQFGSGVLWNDNDSK